MTNDLKINETESSNEHEVNAVKLNDVNEAKLITLTCPRCKTEIRANAELLAKDIEHVICTSCLAEFKLNYVKRMELNELIKPTVEVESVNQEIN